MNNKKRLTFLIAPIFLALAAGQSANADHQRFSTSVNYELLCRSAEGLQYIAHDLRDCFTAEFRRADDYGKLISRSNRLKQGAKRLHRRGLSRSTCNWRSEIQRLDDLICELGTLVDKSVYASRRYSPICPVTLRKVRFLLNDAQRHVAKLERSLRQIEYTDGPGCYARPAIIQQPLRFNDVAPAFPPVGDFGRRSYRPDQRESYTRYPHRNLNPALSNAGFDLATLRNWLK